MSKREKHTAFLRALVLDTAPTHPRPLLDRISRAECDENCSRRAFRVVLILGVFALFAQFYLSLLAPDSLGKSSHQVSRWLSALSAASLVSGVTFLACWLWHRALLDGVHEESRRFIVAAMASRTEARAPAQPLPAEPTRGEACAEVTSRLPEPMGSGRGYWDLFSLRRSS
jgi:hypothetical protein